MVRVVREAVGDDVDIMLECYMGFNYAYSARLLKELEPCNLRWVEEMLLPDEIHNFAKLKKLTSIPLSGGEHEYTRFGFHDLLQAEALDIYQNDQALFLPPASRFVHRLHRKWHVSHPPYTHQPVRRLPAH